MTNFDFSPFYRSIIGFDRLANRLDSVSRNENSQGFPPYNVEQVDDKAYRITLAVAGFDETELDIQVEQGTLTVKGQKVKASKESADAKHNGQKRKYLYQGIAERNFERRFQLADHIEVKAARVANGLLHIDMMLEVPEAAKPKRIAINSVEGVNQLLDSANDSVTSNNDEAAEA